MGISINNQRYETNTITTNVAQDSPNDQARDALNQMLTILADIQNLQGDPSAQEALYNDRLMPELKELQQIQGIKVSIFDPQTFITMISNSIGILGTDIQMQICLPQGIQNSIGNIQELLKYLT